MSGITIRFLEWSCQKLEALGKKVLLLIWDNASWHISKEVRRWLSSWLSKHNCQVRKSGEGVRIVSCLLPEKSPWLNAIEPKWVHGKRKVVESDALLGAYELSPTEFAGSSIVRITSIYLFTRRSPDHALSESPEN